MKNLSTVIFIVIFFLLTGCAGTVTKRGMLDDNTYYSTYNPNVQVKVNPDFVHIEGRPGHFQHQFMNVRDRKRIFIHHFKESPNPGPVDYYYNPSTWIFWDIKMSERIETGTKEISGKKWYYCYFIKRPGNGGCMLVRDLAIFTRDHDILKIRYVKMLLDRHCNNWANADLKSLTDIQMDSLKNFKAEFSKDIKISDFIADKGSEQKPEMVDTPKE